MRKEELERTLTATAIKPVHRTAVAGQDVFIADGFMPPEQLKYLSRFGMTATAEEYPFGAFVTIWYRDGKIGFGGIAICELSHDPGHSFEARQNMRVNSVLSLARQDFAKRRKMN